MATTCLQMLCSRFGFFPLQRELRNLIRFMRDHRCSEQLMNEVSNRD